MTIILSISSHRLFPSSLYTYFSKSMSNCSEMQVAEFQQWLPSGWVVEIRQTRNGRRDKYYISPDGTKFRSKVGVFRYLGMGEVSVPSEGCSTVVKVVEVRRKKRCVRVFRRRPLGKSMDWLPPAWEVVSRERKNGRTIDKYYIASNGTKFNSKVGVCRYLQTGEFSKRHAWERVTDNVESADLEYSLSNVAKIRKLARNCRRRRSFSSGQSSNTTNMKNSELVLKSADVQRCEGVGCCNDRSFLLLPSDANNLESSQKHAVSTAEKNNELVLISADIQCREDPLVAAGVERSDDRRLLLTPSDAKDLERSQKHSDCKTLTHAVPLSVCYPENQPVQQTIEKLRKRKSKPRPHKTQNKREHVNKKAKPNPPNEPTLPRRTSRRLAGLKPDLSPKTSSQSKDVLVDKSPEVDTAQETCSLRTEKKVNGLRKTHKDHDDSSLKENMKKIESKKWESVMQPEVASEMMNSNKDVPVKTSSEVDNGEGMKSLGMEGKVNEVELTPEIGPETSNGSQHVLVKARPEADTMPGTSNLGIEDKANELKKSPDNKVGRVQGENKIESEKSEAVRRPKLFPETTSGNQDFSVVLTPEVGIEFGLPAIKENSNELGMVHEEKGDRDDSLDVLVEAIAEVCMAGAHSLGIEEQGIGVGKTQEKEGDKVLERNTKKIECERPESVLNDFSMVISLLETGNDVPAGTSVPLHTGEDMQILGVEEQESEIRKTCTEEVDCTVEEKMMTTESEKSEFGREPELATMRGNQDVAVGYIAELRTGEGTNSLGKTLQDEFYDSLEEEMRKLEIGRSVFIREPELSPETTRDDQDVPVAARASREQRTRESSNYLGMEKSKIDPWRTHAEEYTRKLESSRKGWIVTLPPFRASSLDPCIEFANKTLAGLIPIEHLPLNLVHEW